MPNDPNGTRPKASIGSLQSHNSRESEAPPHRACARRSSDWEYGDSEEDIETIDARKEKARTSFAGPSLVPKAGPYNPYSELGIPNPEEPRPRIKQPSYPPTGLSMNTNVGGQHLPPLTTQHLNSSSTGNAPPLPPPGYARPAFGSPADDGRRAGTNYSKSPVSAGYPENARVNLPFRERMSDPRSNQPSPPSSYPKAPGTSSRGYVRSPLSPSAMSLSPRQADYFAASGDPSWVSPSSPSGDIQDLYGRPVDAVEERKRRPHGSPLVSSPITIVRRHQSNGSQDPVTGSASSNSTLKPGMDSAEFRLQKVEAGLHKLRSERAEARLSRLRMMGTWKTRMEGELPTHQATLKRRLRRAFDDDQTVRSHVNYWKWDPVTASRDFESKVEELSQALGTTYTQSVNDIYQQSVQENSIEPIPNSTVDVRPWVSVCVPATSETDSTPLGFRVTAGCNLSMNGTEYGVQPSHHLYRSLRPTATPIQTNQTMIRRKSDGRDAYPQDRRGGEGRDTGYRDGSTQVSSARGARDPGRPPLGRGESYRRDEYQEDRGEDGEPSDRGTRGSRRPEDRSSATGNSRRRRK